MVKTYLLIIHFNLTDCMTHYMLLDIPMRQ